MTLHGTRRDQGNREPVNDQPIKSGEEDRFDRREFAERIARTIIERRDPSSLVIGLLGPWGSGKTSILRLMLNELRHYKYVGRTADGSPDGETLEPIVVQFNPWYFEDESQLIRSFFNTLSDHVSASGESTRTKMGDALKQYGRKVSSLVKAIDPALTVLGAIAPGAGLAGKVGDLLQGDALEALGEVLSPSLAGLDRLREQVNAALRETDRRVVVLVDDIDRLDIHEIQAVFKLMKLSADFERITYIVAFDPKIVSAALAQSYAGDETAGADFLEKIVQIPLYIPGGNIRTTQELVFEGIEEAVQAAGIPWLADDGADFRRQFGRGFAARLLTPRAAKRYVMAVEFVLPLLKNEVHPVDFTLIEAFRLFYPRVYALIRDNPEMFLVGPEAYMSGPAELADEIQAEGEREAQKFREGLSDLPDDERAVVMQVLVRLFPRITSYENAFTQDDDDRWALEQRIASGMHFYRYFQYAVPSGDIADQDLRAFLDDLPRLGLDLLVERLRLLAQGQRTQQLVKKLSAVRLAVPPPAVSILARGLARLGNDVPRPEPSPGWSYSPTHAISRLCSELLKRVPRGHERDELAEAIVTEAKSPIYATDLWDEMRVDRFSLPRRPLVSREAVSKIDSRLADTIRKAALVTLPHEAYGHEAPDLYESWARYSSADDVRSVLLPAFKRDPSQAGKFLAVFAPFEADELTGAPRRGKLSRYAYEQITKLIEPEVLMSFLEQAYQLSDAQQAPHPQRHIHRSFEERAAQQFVDIFTRHRHSNDSKSRTESQAQPT